MPVILDAGIGTASDATLAMEAGLRRGLAGQRDLARAGPGAMAVAMRMAVEAGYEARRAGRIPRRLYGEASSPVEGVAELT